MINWEDVKHKNFAKDVKNLSREYLINDITPNVEYHLRRKTETIPFLDLIDLWKTEGRFVGCMNVTNNYARQDVHSCLYALNRRPDTEKKQYEKRIADLRKQLSLLKLERLFELIPSKKTPFIIVKGLNDQKLTEQEVELLMGRDDFEMRGF